MQQTVLVALVICVQLTFGQFTGGLEGPCSATTIPGPFEVPINVFGNTGVPNVSSTSNSLCISSNSPAVWYTIQPENSNQITVSTCAVDTTFDTIISVYTGNCLQLSCLTFSDDDTVCDHPRTSSVLFTPTAFQTYYISVGGFGTSTGIFQMFVSEAGGVTAGGSCTNAFSISSPAEVFDTNQFGTGFTSGCTSTDYKYTWYVLEDVQTGIPVNITTCSTETNFDTVIAVFNSCSNTTCAAYNDDVACDYRLTASSIIYTPYSSSLFIAVGGFGGGFGDYLLSVSQAGITAEEACHSARPTIFYILEYGYNYASVPIISDPCNQLNDFKTSWFYFQTQNVTNFLASTCNPVTNFNTKIVVYSGAGCGNLTCVSTTPTNYCTSLGASKVKAADYWDSVTPTASVTPTSSPTSSRTPSPGSSPSRTPTPSVYPSNTAQFGNAVTFSLPQSLTLYGYIAVTGATPTDTGAFYLYVAPITS